MSTNAQTPALPDAPIADDLPQHARERIREMREKKLFTSDLSVSEFLLVKQAGFDPLGLVMGSSIYQIAPSFPALSRGQPGCELTEMTRALYHARELAMNRMEEEAAELGADGIVGVRVVVNLTTDPQRAEWQICRMWRKWAREQGYQQRITQLGPAWLTTWRQVAWAQWMDYCRRMGLAQQPPPWELPQSRKNYAFGQNVAEFLTIGTAVRHRDGESFKNAAGRPFQSDLTGQELWTLIRAGYRPVGFVMGNCVYYVPPAMLQAPAEVSCELPAYTHALYDARELAIERLQYEAEALKATGIVGVTVADQQHSWRANIWDVGNAALSNGEVIELFVFGTAVVPMAGAGAAPRPVLVVSASDKVAAAAAEGSE